MHYIIAFGVIIAVLVFWIKSVQRSLAVLDENIDNALLQISVQLSSQWDSLISLLDLTKGYAVLDYGVLTDAVRARRTITKDSSHEEIKTQEIIIEEVLGKVIDQGERHPDLKADGNYIKALDAVNQYENMLRTSRLIYNDSAAKLNRAIRIFPLSMIAGILGFVKRPYMEAAD